MRDPRTVLFAASLLFSAACRAPAEARDGRPDADVARAEVERTLDAFHRAASQADGEAYFELLDEDAVFLGTDATERWSVPEFRDWAEPYFASGRGWTYAVVRRQVTLGPSGGVAWFDEELDNEAYGTCRGTGVLRRRAGAWRIVQYNLALPVPNELARDLVARIRALAGPASEGGESAPEDG